MPETTRRMRVLRDAPTGFALRAALLCSSFGATTSAARGNDAHASRCFAIQVIDEDTGCGVPLVELKTTSNVVYVTDSAGLAAIDEPGLMGQKVFFYVASHGYEFPRDGFGYRGKALDVEPGGSATLKIKRLNIAERLYRVTGQGIYADSVRLGRDVPLSQPLLNAQVTGQDSVQTAEYGGKVYWFWGDTNRLSYPLGQFSTSGAVSELPAKGGLDPAVGVNLTYFVDDHGFSRKMIPLEKPGAVWVDAVLTLKDPGGRERLVCHYARMRDLGHREEHGLAVFDDEKEQFVVLRQLPDDARLFPQGHDLRVKDADGTEYIYFATVYPHVRVRATWEDFLEPASYESFTPLKAGSDYDKDSPALDQDADGRLRYAWKRDTALVPPADMNRLVEAGVIPADESRMRAVDAGTDKPITLHGGSVHWNEHRRRYVMIALQVFGSASMLGEIYYLESERPEGPWHKAVKIVTHDKYSFYNPTQHVFFDQDGGRTIYFEGTYTHTFSGNPQQTPRYDYNQIMYRLDLADERLAAAH
jgi:hypothetical protein